MVNHRHESRPQPDHPILHDMYTEEGQFRHYKSICRDNEGRVFRVIIRLDTSTPRQSSAEVAVYLPAVGFSPLLVLFGNEVFACKQYHTAAPVERENKVLSWLEHTHAMLLGMGKEIVREGG